MVWLIAGAGLLLIIGVVRKTHSKIWLRSLVTWLRSLKPRKRERDRPPVKLDRAAKVATQALEWGLGPWLEAAMWLLTALAVSAGAFVSYNSLMRVFRDVGGFEVWEARVAPLLVDAPLGATVIAIYLMARWGKLGTWAGLQLGSMAIISAVATLSGNALAGAFAKGQLHLSGGWALTATLIVSAFPAICILELILATKVVLAAKAELARAAAGLSPHPAERLSRSEVTDISPAVKRRTPAAAAQAGREVEREAQHQRALAGPAPLSATERSALTDTERRERAHAHFMSAHERGEQASGADLAALTGASKPTGRRWRSEFERELEPQSVTPNGHGPR